jgi:hypothetical protein
MQFTYQCAYKVKGILHAGTKPDLHVLTNPSMDLSVTVCGDLVPHWKVLNRQLAIATLMLQGGLGKPPEEFKRLLAAEIEKLDAQMAQSAALEGFVVVTAHGAVEASLPEKLVRVDDYVVCFDAYDKDAIKREVRPKVSATLTALRIALERPCKFEFVTEGSYLSTTEGEIIHSYSASFGGASAYVAAEVTEPEASVIAQYIQRISNAASFDKPLRLHTESLEASRDNFRAFLSAWSALEMLVGKLFPIYQELLIADLKSTNSTPGLHAYLDQMASVMKSKHRLADKFSVISSYLDEEEKSDDLAKFLALKRTRDALSHGEEILDTTLPTREVQSLFDKYFQNHIRRPDCK